MRRYTYFISDLHLGASYLRPKIDYEKRVVEWLMSIKDDASALYLLGDVLDYWFEYRTAVPRGFTRFFGALATLADAGVEIYWFTGNHDIWLFDYLRDEIGLHVVDGEMEKRIGNHTFFLAHGDGVGNLKPSFRFMRTMFRNRACQKLYSGIHPRWTIPFALRWSCSSRNFSEEIPVVDNPEEESLVKFARDYSVSHPEIDYYVFGHKHVVLDYPVNAHSRVIILGDWIHHFSFARYNGETVELFKYVQENSKIVHI